LRFARVLKGLQLLVRPHLAKAAMRHGVAAAVEHLIPIRHMAAATLIDVGASKGQFSLAFRSQRPNARIIAFEPLSDSAETYERLFRNDTQVTLHRVAIADRQGVAEFFVADREDSSSLLRPGEGQAQAFGVRGKRTVRVDVKRLDDCVAIPDLPHPILLKIDVQGGELDVLKGCAALESIDYIYCELSFVELYEGQPLFDEVASYLGSRGFRLAGAFNQAMTDAFGPAQADFLFKRMKDQD
jgi:FkbM family methyltransferase